MNEQNSDPETLQHKVSSLKNEIQFYLSKNEILTILMFIAFNSDIIQKHPYFNSVQVVKNRLIKMLGTSISQNEFEDWKQNAEIDSIFKK